MVFDFFIFTLFPFLAVITVIVFVHEMGHYLVARWCGVGVEAFSIGFGPTLYFWRGKDGTIWRICCIPLGGYVQFVGDSDGASTPDRDAIKKMDKKTLAKSFEHKPLWQKSLIVVAGPVANFLLAIILYTGIFYSFGDIKVQPIIADVVPNSSAERAGLLVGDKILSINGNKISTFDEVSNHVLLNTDKPMLFEIERKSYRYEIELTPVLVERIDRFGNKYKSAQAGISADNSSSNSIRVPLGLGEAVGKGLYETWFIVRLTFQFLKELFAGKQDVKELRGPVGIGQITGQFASLGFVALIFLTAVISVSIGLLNLFPIPMLDGGHLLFYGISAIIRRPVPEKVVDWSHKFGFIMLIGFMLYVTSNDILRILPLY